MAFNEFTFPTRMATNSKEEFIGKNNKYSQKDIVQMTGSDNAAGLMQAEREYDARMRAEAAGMGDTDISELHTSVDEILLPSLSDVGANASDRFAGQTLPSDKAAYRFVVTPNYLDEEIPIPANELNNSLGMNPKNPHAALGKLVSGVDDESIDDYNTRLAKEAYLATTLAGSSAHKTTGIKMQQNSKGNSVKKVTASKDSYTTQAKNSDNTNEYKNSNIYMVNEQGYPTLVARSAMSPSGSGRVFESVSTELLLAKSGEARQAARQKLLMTRQQQMTEDKFLDSGEVEQLAAMQQLKPAQAALNLNNYIQERKASTVPEDGWAYGEGAEQKAAQIEQMTGVKPSALDLVNTPQKAVSFLQANAASMDPTDMMILDMAYKAQQIREGRREASEKLAGFTGNKTGMQRNTILDNRGKLYANRVETLPNVSRAADSVDAHLFNVVQGLYTDDIRIPTDKNKEQQIEELQSGQRSKVPMRRVKAKK